MSELISESLLISQSVLMSERCSHVRETMLIYESVLISESILHTHHLQVRATYSFVLLNNVYQTDLRFQYCFEKVLKTKIRYWYLEKYRHYFFTQKYRLLGRQQFVVDIYIAIVAAVSVVRVTVFLLPKLLLQPLPFIRVFLPIQMSGNHMYFAVSG